MQLKSCIIKLKNFLFTSEEHVKLFNSLHFTDVDITGSNIIDEFSERLTLKPFSKVFFLQKMISTSVYVAVRQQQSFHLTAGWLLV